MSRSPASGSFAVVVVAGTMFLVVAALVTVLLTGGEPQPGTGPTPPPGSTPPPSPTAVPSMSPAPTTAPDPDDPSCLPDGSVPVRVVSFNIRSARGPYGVDLARIAAEIRATHADVVLLQEVDRFRARTGGVDQAARLARRLGMQHVFSPMVSSAPARPGAPRQQYGIATLTRLPLLDHEVTTLPRPTGTEQRGVLRVDLRAGTRTISVFNTHLDHSSAAARAQQTRVLQVELNQVSHPRVLGGDLNSVPGSATHRALTGTLADVWSVVGRGRGLTVPERTPRRRIDYVLVDREFTPAAAQVHRSAVSDHRFLRADLHLAPHPCG